MILAEMLHLPWTWQGPEEVHEQDRSVHFELRIQELPNFFVASTSRDEVLARCWDALAAFLQPYLDHQENPPLPARSMPVWVPGAMAVAAQDRIPEVRRANEPVLVAS